MLYTACLNVVADNSYQILVTAVHNIQ